MADLPDPIMSDASMAEILANTTLFDYRVEKLESGEFCVFAGPFPIRDYPTEAGAHLLCKLLINQQARIAQKRAPRKSKPRTPAMPTQGTHLPVCNIRSTL
jgi:hypothetical protein